MRNSSALSASSTPPIDAIWQSASWLSMAVAASETGRICGPEYPPIVGVRERPRSTSTPMSPERVSIALTAFAPARSTAWTNSREDAA